MICHPVRDVQPPPKGFDHARRAMAEDEGDRGLQAGGGEHQPLARLDLEAARSIAAPVSRAGWQPPAILGHRPLWSAAWRRSRLGWRIVEDYSAFDSLELLKQLGLRRTLLAAPRMLRALRDGRPAQ